MRAKSIKVHVTTLVSVSFLLFGPSSSQAESSKYDHCDCVPGEVMIGFKNIIEMQDVDSISNHYGLTWKALDPGDKPTWGQLAVPEKQEKAWIEILKSFPFVEYVEPNYRIYAQSVGSHVPVNEWKPQLSISRLEANNFSEGFPDYMREFIDLEYSGAHRCYIVPLGERAMRVEVTGIRSKVIPEKRYWENITIHLIDVASDGSSDTRLIYVMLEGWYTSGLGSPPDSQAFRSMEPTYSDSLNRYLTKLQSGLVDFFSKGKAK
jgi:hypothetical protein